jgi:hypothetical protein
LFFLIRYLSGPYAKSIEDLAEKRLRFEMQIAPQPAPEDEDINPHELYIVSDGLMDKELFDFLESVTKFCRGPLALQKGPFLNIVSGIPSKRNESRISKRSS